MRTLGAQAALPAFLQSEQAGMPALSAQSFKMIVPRQFDQSYLRPVHSLNGA